jgi:hypothetical protein
MEYIAASVRRKRSDSESESQDNTKKFAASSDCSYSPPPAAKSGFKINRSFGKSQVDGIDDEDLSVSGSEFLEECSPFIVDRCMFSMGSGDTEVNGHLDDHDPFNAKGPVSPASCKTVEGDASGCCAVVEIPSPSLVSTSLVVGNVSIPSGYYPWTSDFDGEGCNNCENIFEKYFQQLSTQEQSIIFNNIDRPLLYGHDSTLCPFFNLRGQCRYCNKPGTDLNNSGIINPELRTSGHLHWIIDSFEAGDPDCSCCMECDYSTFMKDKEGGDQLVALVELRLTAQVIPRFNTH